MTQTTKTGLYLLPAALALGLTGDVLLRETPWGLNVLLWTCALIGVFGLLSRSARHQFSGEGIWLAAPALVLAGCLAWRDSPTLRTLDIIGLVGCLGIGAARTTAGQVHLSGLLEYLAETLRSVFLSVFGGFPLLFKEIAWDTVPRGGWLPRTLSALRGLLLVLPLLLLFGALLSSADAIYRKLLLQTFHFDLGALTGHFFFTLLVAWLAAGFGRTLFSHHGSQTQLSRSDRSGPVLGTVETGIMLGLLNLLFFSFVLVQIRYFFGGAALVSATAGLTYTQYARTGFFELVWVAALVLPLLLGLHRLQNTASVRGTRLFAVQAAVQVVLLSVILASAVLRMRLYQEACGLTELRLYTMAFMGWLAVVFAWFSWTVLRGHRERFAFGAVTAAFVLVVGLHVLNPDALIVRVNAARSTQSHTFDADYAASLSADAVPPLVAALASLPPDARGQVASALLPRLSEGRGDWRSWNWGRMTAFHAVQSHQAPLKAAVPPPAKSGACGCGTDTKTTTTMVTKHP